MQFKRSEPEMAEFEFRGKAGEWFGIWLTNLLLTIVTAGIYSAWAKVRSKKYFYQNTYVAGRNFDYHATGLQILIGRIIFVVGLVLFSLLSAIPLVGVLLFIGLLFLLPLLLVRSLRFNAAVTSWSNVRFGFDGKPGGAFMAYFLYPFLTAFTLYLAWPFADRARRRYVTNNHRLGQAAFTFDSGIGPFYAALLAAIGWVLLVTMVVMVFAGAAITAVFANPEAIESDPTVIVAFYAWIFLAFFPAATIYAAFIRNALFNGTTLDGAHQMRSDVKPVQLVWIAISNAVVVLCTLGLMLPWAQIRLARYNAAHTQLIPGGSLDDFVGKIEQKGGALGDAYTDIEAVDVGLPI